MYLAVVALLMLILPVASIVVAWLAGPGQATLIALIGEWFVFWAIGVRLATAGVRQIIRPGLTSEGILRIPGEAVYQIVRELGFANLGIGLVGIGSLWASGWRPAAAVAGGLFLLLAGLLHSGKAERDFDENVALISNLFVALVMAVYLAGTLLGS